MNDPFVDLPDGARAYRDALPAGDVHVFPISALDRTGIPTWKAVFFSRDGTEAVYNGHGYGATDAQALLGALGELSEDVHAHEALRCMRRERGTYRSLARAHGGENVVHPWRLSPPAGSAVDAASERAWVAGKRFGGDEVWLPLDVVAVTAADARDYAPFVTPITNGLGAGPTLAFALAHGLQELLQRDGNGLRFRALDAGVAVDLAAVDDAVVRDLLARFAAAQIEPIVKFADDAFDVTNVYAVGAERPGIAAPFPLVVTAAGEAASPSRDAALRKALLEFGAARARKRFAHAPLGHLVEVAPPDYLARVRELAAPSREEPRALHAMLQWLELDQDALRATIDDPILRIRARRDASALPDRRPSSDGAPPGVELAQTLAGRLTAAGLDVLYVDFTTGAMAERGVHVVKAIVPGLEVETMSYYRIGERNARKLLAMGGGLVTRAPGEGRRRVRLLPDAEERLNGPLWLDIAAVDRTVGALYPLYREPGVHAAPLAREALAR